MSEEKNLEVFNEYVQKFTECKSVKEVVELNKCYNLIECDFKNLYEVLVDENLSTGNFYPFEYDEDIYSLQRVEPPRKYIHIKMGNGLSNRVLEPIKKMPEEPCDIVIPSLTMKDGYNIWHIDPSVRPLQKTMKRIIENTGYYLVGEEEDCAKFTKSLLRPNIETFE